MYDRVIYVAGPYRAEGANRIEENIYMARVFARLLWCKGWAVICPHMNTAHMDGEEPDDLLHGDILAGDKEMLRRCDAIFLLPEWKESEGAREELAVAKDARLKIYDNVDGIPSPISCPKKRK